MSTETIIVIVTSCTSLLVAFVSIIAAVISSLQARRTAESLEKLKYQYSLSENTQNLRDENFQEGVLALRKIIQSIQKLKDNLQIVLYDTSLPPPRIEEIISACRADLLAVYEEHMVHYNEQEKLVGHEAKNTALTVERLIKKAIKPEPFEGIETEPFNKLLELRNQLTDMQNLLRDSMMQKMYNRLGGAKT